ncbi:MAG: hypothetical protein NXI24_01140 [bacterium]|nr:hypothetical protein [bacterium]
METQSSNTSPTNPGLSNTDAATGSTADRKPPEHATVFDREVVSFWLKPSLMNLVETLAQETGPEVFARAVAAAVSEDGRLDHDLILDLGEQNFVEGLQKWSAEGRRAGWWESLELESIDYSAPRAVLRVVGPWELLLQLSQPEEERWGCPFLCGKLTGVFSLVFGTGCQAGETLIPDEDNQSIAGVRVEITPGDQSLSEELAIARESGRSQRELALSSEVAQSGAELREARRQLEETNRTLEQRVFERTRELQSAKSGLERALNETDKLNEFSRKLNEERDVDGVIRQILTHLIFSFDTDGVWLLSIDQDTGEIFTKGSSYAFAMQLPEETTTFLNEFRTPIEIGGSSIYYPFSHRRPLTIRHVGSHLHNANELEKRIARDLAITGCLQIPLIADNQVVAILCMLWVRQGGVNLPESDLGRLYRFCDQIKGALHNSNLMSRVEAEREQSERLLQNVLPASVAQELKERGSVEPMVYESVSVVFTDFVGFTSIAETMSPIELVEELDGCFTQFDEIIARHGLEKLKTIGDAYMCCGGLPELSRTHRIDSVLAALEFRDFMNQMAMVKQAANEDFWQIRIGLHCGGVMAGVVGKNKFAYDIWGDTVNTASRMESSGTPGEVNISGAIYEQAQYFFKCKYRGRVQAKGKGAVDMYFVERLRKQFSADPEGRVPNDEFRRVYDLISAGKQLRFRKQSDSAQS